MVLLASKLRPPHLPGVLIERRSQLFALLETGLTRPITLLQAPAGSGKTTLVAQWLSGQRTEELWPSWVSLDASDNDPQRFWRYVIAACQVQQPSLGAEALVLLSSPTSSPFTLPPLETVVTLLLNELAQQEHAQLLVLDDYHVIVEPALHQTLTFFLDHLPATFHVLLLSRAEPPLPLLRWRASGVLGELHAPDLRFSSEETAAFLRQAVPAQLSPETLTQLDALSEGWAAGLRLLSLTLRGQRTVQEVETFLHSLSSDGPSRPDLSALPTLSRSLLDYFVSEILRAQPEPLQLFLLQTSGLAYLSGALCDAVTRRADSSALLATMERAGLFLEMLDEADPSGPWYRFHGLWAEALRREARHTLSEETLHALAERSSLWYEQHMMITEAIEAALLAKDAARATRLLDQAMTHGQQWNPPTLLRWLSQVPDEVLSNHPGLSLLFAILLRFPQGKEDAALPGEVWERIETILQMAEEGWRDERNLSWLGGLYAFRAISVLPQGQFANAVDYARQALRWLPKTDAGQGEASRPEIQVWRGVSLFILGIQHFYDGQLAEVQQLLQEAYICSLSSDDKHFTREILVLQAANCAARGELHQAAEYYHQVLANSHEQEHHEDSASALLGLARLAFEWNELATAEQEIHEALELQCHQETRISDQATFQLALLEHARGHTTSAQQQLATLLARLQTTPWNAWLRTDILNWQIQLHLLTGDISAAQRSLSVLTRDAQKREGLHLMRTQILQARLLLAQGEADEARQQLEALLPDVQQHWQIRHALEIQLLLSLAEAALQRKSAALRWLTQTLREAQSEGFVRLFLEEGEALARLLVPIQASGLRSYVRTILSSFTSLAENTLPDGNTTRNVQSMLAEQLSPQELRVLQLLAEGHSNPQIANELLVSVNTVKYHIKQLYRKLNVSNRLEACEAARHLNLC